MSSLSGPCTSSAVQTEAASRYCSQTALNIPARPSRAAVFPDPGPWSWTANLLELFEVHPSPLGATEPVRQQGGDIQGSGVRTENCPPGMKTGDQISPPAGYVGGGLQMRTDIAISPSGDVWVMNNW
jgi:hypothetical protein